MRHILNELIVVWTALSRNIFRVPPLARKWACVFTPCAPRLTVRASLWRLERALAQISCLKDALQPIHFGENLVEDQCLHADELRSGVARGPMIMVGACRNIAGALVGSDGGGFNGNIPQVHRWQGTDITRKGQSHFLCPGNETQPWRLTLRLQLKSGIFHTKRLSTRSSKVVLNTKLHHSAYFNIQFKKKKP